MAGADELKRRNRVVAGAAVGVIVVMGGLVAVSPIFYHLFAAYIGYGASVEGGKTVRSLSDTGTGNSIAVRFDTNIAGGLPVTFKPNRPTVAAAIGKPHRIDYDVTNRSGEPVILRLVFDVTPDWAAPYFFKSVGSLKPVERLAAGETVHVPLVFYVDRRILEDKLARNVSQITLSYTLFRQKGPPGRTAGAMSDLGKQATAFRRHLDATGSATFANGSHAD